MKNSSIARLLPLGLALMVTLSGLAWGASPKQEFQRALAQFRQAPSDDLRGQLIQLAGKMRPAPAVPDEALDHVGRGVFLFKHAANKTDYVKAAQEYEQAIAAAPWDVDYYSDVCTIYDKAEDYANAKRSCSFALMGTTNPQDVASLKERIAGFKMGLEQAATASNQKQQKRNEFASFLRSIEGAAYRGRIVDNRPYGWTVWDELRVEDGRLLYGMATNNQNELTNNPRYTDPRYPGEQWRWRSGGVWSARLPGFSDVEENGGQVIMKVRITEAADYANGTYGRWENGSWVSGWWNMSPRCKDGSIENRTYAFSRNGQAVTMTSSCGDSVALSRNQPVPATDH